MLVDLSTVKGAVAVIAAAGAGTRMGADKPKQYLPLAGKTVLEITVEKFLGFEGIECVVLIVPPNDQDCYQLPVAEKENVYVIDGGERRTDSVLNGLMFLYDAGLPDDVAVLVHDAARPCVSKSDLQKLIDTFRKSKQPCLLAAPVVDTLQEVNAKGDVKRVVDRDKLVRAFTPQVARFIDLKTALIKARDEGVPVTDEVSALTSAGHKVKAVIGQSNNIKITHPEDLPLAEYYLKQEK
ncbi:2-C-methyl-D-erythritol 4-phosphate cytidylyltransferase [Aliikangiella sp. G2MR2-5]|uniref:2-C-methyl-D-erythritol 4-phosphate cytidylyltransferase n=1 Tax=Aliikangiella sp. G2MR2-5 TaxID=2788943 RepID=UPI0018ABC5BB|nr:2-C-methyl-D-erythritol 4-phosphate cytidylyltransferase [Aliikangiella sp. G2MR2-5]